MLNPCGPSLERRLPCGKCGKRVGQSVPPAPRPRIGFRGGLSALSAFPGAENPNRHAPASSCRPCGAPAEAPCPDSARPPSRSRGSWPTGCGPASGRSQCAACVGPVENRACLRPPEERHGAEDPRDRNGPRRSDDHAREHGSQHEPAAPTPQPDCALLNPPEPELA